LLKAHDRHRQIYWWISSDLAELLEGDPDLDGTILFQRKRWGLPWFWREVWQSLRQIRGHTFDLVIDLQGLARSSLVAWLARGQFVIGVEDWREGAPALYDLGVPRPSAQTHAVDWYLEVLRQLRVPVHWNFTWLPVRPKAASRVADLRGGACGRWVLLHPGARWPNKRWPIQYFAESAAQLSRAHPELRFGVLGTKGDAELGAAIMDAIPGRGLDLTGQTSLSEMIEWIRGSQVVITNDTGPMHVAAALGVPAISVFGPTDPRRTGPYGQLSNSLSIALSCAPCLKPTCHFAKPMECLRALRPAAVCARAETVLAVNN
jgi:lipopolysaccharide heptosyltransferase II